MVWHSTSNLKELSPMSCSTGIIDAEAIATVRLLAVDMVEKARSGHPGLPLGATPMAYTLFTRIMRHNPADPGWPDRDRFVLSAGHGSALLYALLHLCGYGLDMEELKSFRQFGSRTPGHPEYGHTPGVETTTGPLGQGISTAVGMALAERLLASRLNTPDLTLIDHCTYVICSDGDLMEGVSSEASSLAGHLGLGKLICLYDDNGISIEGPTGLTFTENVRLRYEAYGWQVDEVDGNDLQAIERAVNSAREVIDRPSMILVHTTIGYGSPHKAGTAAAHGEPLGPDEARAVKERFGFSPDGTFVVPEAVGDHFRRTMARCAALEAAWQERWNRFAETSPERATALRKLLEGGFPENWLPPEELFDSCKPMATRQASKAVLSALCGNVPFLVGGSADLGPSTGTALDRAVDVQAGHFEGFNIHFGVREHAMGAILNGMALSGMLVPYGGTFLIFSDYMKPAIRLAALMRLHVIWIFTHDSIGLGEDGPTHQPVEQLAMLRAIPGLEVLRPADSRETLAAWRLALSGRGPAALVLTRQSLPCLDADRRTVLSGTERGAYIVADWPEPGTTSTPKVLLIATGSEVHPAISARTLLQQQGIAARVVSMPSRRRFDEQPEAYRNAVIPPEIPARLVIEAASPYGWDGLAGPGGMVLGIDRFGASAPGGEVMQAYGFTPEHIAETAGKLAGAASGS
ncbi:MAG: transketolase [Chlorobiaceae bacterium]|nr:transketolase [Chlorobiaceae bacterium]